MRDRHVRDQRLAAAARLARAAIEHDVAVTHLVRRRSSLRALGEHQRVKRGAALLQRLEDLLVGLVAELDALGDERDDDRPRRLVLDEAARRFDQPLEQIRAGARLREQPVDALALAPPRRPSSAFTWIVGRSPSVTNDTECPAAVSAADERAEAVAHDTGWPARAAWLLSTRSATCMGSVAGSTFSTSRATPSSRTTTSSGFDVFDRHALLVHDRHVQGPLPGLGADRRRMTQGQAGESRRTGAARQDRTDRTRPTARARRVEDDAGGLGARVVSPER